MQVQGEFLKMGLEPRGAPVVCTKLLAAIESRVAGPARKVRGEGVLHLFFIRVVDDLNMVTDCGGAARRCSPRTAREVMRPLRT